MTKIDQRIRTRRGTGRNFRLAARRLTWIVPAATIIVAGGCASMFPYSRAVVKSQWKDYAEVQAAFEQVVPHRTTVEDLRAAGFDPLTSPNVKLLNYVEIIPRFIPNPAIRKEDLDDGVRNCLDAKQHGYAYEIELSDSRSKRHGNLFLDVLSFRRETTVTGWEFRGLILLTNNTVVYKLSSGQPSVSREDKRVRPLGPLQEIDNILSGLRMAK